MVTKVWAVVRTQFTRLHCWPDAPDEVAFLASPHRHVFHVVVHLQQFHNERDVEYILFKMWLDKAIASKSWPMSTSCETFAETISHMIRVAYPKRGGLVGVNEDGENGALVEFEA